MIKLKKLLDREFIVLNLSDPQLTNAEWSEGHAHRRILETTVKELIERCSPDLITVSGDFAWAGHDHSYDAFAVFLDSFGIPWAPVWGNHDNQNGTDYIDENAVRFMSFPNCIYENGDLSLGRGNYVILIEEDDRPIEALFMLDSHDRMPFTDENGEEKNAWGKLTVEQINWYLDETKRLKQMGCKDSTIIRHIPIYGYKTAADAAFKQSLSRRDISLEQATTDVCWNEGYTDSEGGVMHEEIGCYPADDGVFAAIKKAGMTKHIIAGHDHVNNFIINYEGVRLIFSLKAGAGCYWEPALNGGTLLKINSEGVYRVCHEYVDVSEILKEF